jgi:acetyl esterase/lipase
MPCRATLWIWLAIAAAAAAASGPAEQGAQHPPFVLPDSVQMSSDIVYAQAGAETLRLDVFAPRQRTGPVPGIVLVSCGSWIVGAKSQVWPQSAYVAARGFVAAATECRPAPAARFPAQLNDTAAAVRWLRQHASEHGVDPRRIAIGGGSSGGHLSALVGTNLWNGSAWSGAPTDSRVQAAVVFNGVLDLRSFVTPSGVNTNLTAFLGSSFEENPALWLDASPLEHVSKEAAPFLLLHATDDDVAPYRQSVDMQRRLRAAGISAELFTASRAGHNSFLQPPWFEPALARTVEFLNAVFSSRPSHKG